MYLKTSKSKMRLKLNAAWLLFAIFLPLVSSQKFEGDSCTMKTTSGVCKLASECSELEMAVRSGRFSTRDIVNCGYTTREEIICCPTGDRVTTENRSDDRFIFEHTSTATTTTTSTTTMSPTSTDFWAHLLTTTPSTALETTTPKPDFWLHLLNTTTTTTTPLPLVVNGKQLDPDSGFIDLADLLSQNGRRQKNNALPEKGEKSTAESNPSLPARPVPDTINDRSFGWPAPSLGVPSSSANWNAPRQQQWNSGPSHAFPTNNGVPFVDDWRNPRKGRVTWGEPVANRQLLQPPNQSNFGWPNQQETVMLRPAVNWNLPQSNRFPNQGNSFPVAAFENPPANSWNKPNQGIWPTNRQVNNFDRRQVDEWQSGNDATSRNNLVENFRPTNIDVSNQNLMKRPIFDRQPSQTGNTLPNGSIWPGSNLRPSPANLNNNLGDPTAMVNDNLIKSGLEIVKAEENELDREYEVEKANFGSEEMMTTPRSSVPDIYAPFRFRPQPNDYDDRSVDMKGSSQEGSNDFRFPGPFERGPSWNIDQSKKTPGNDIGNMTPTPRTNDKINPVTTRSIDRPAVVACREIDAGLDASLSFHILGGIPAELSEFPHMAAIGYRVIGNDDGPYDYRCGGTLIAKRFVLTAAHCVISIDSQPQVALLGLVDIKDPSQRRNADEVRIRQVHIHNDYSNSRTYHDVAILELEREVTYSEFIYPTCLYTDLDDPPSTKPAYVTGWGQINTGSRQKSNILLKAKLNIVPVRQCNASYVEMGLNRRINVGVTNSQMCAHDPGLARDACQGDSGGPLTIVEDEAYRKYRIVGIISAGFSCGSSTPGLYARVASYLDYIESIVWPNMA